MGPSMSGNIQIRQPADQLIGMGSINLAFLWSLPRHNMIGGLWQGCSRGGGGRRAHVGDFWQHGRVFWQSVGAFGEVRGPFDRVRGKRVGVLWNCSVLLCSVMVILC